jgi:hypothetical protein
MYHHIAATSKETSQKNELEELEQSRYRKDLRKNYLYLPIEIMTN